ncbi:MAG: ABC transporter ATP-binding protein, partial [Selenomonadaceae bacterium]|nr:ABC transporter ATP-binding protein [Selenomonadaceae bacterium]
MDENILSVKNLDITFHTNAGDIHAIRGVNFDLPAGKTVALVGESGSGKSVTMKAVTGLLDTNAVINDGQILYDGINLLTLPKKTLRREINGQQIAMIFQDPMTSLDPTMQIGDQITEGLLLHRNISKTDARKRAVELLNLVGISDARKRMQNYPHQLSGGMIQRIVIACALSCEPKILICDEPTTAL